MLKLPRALLGASIAVAGLSRAACLMTAPCVLNAAEKLDLNPAWRESPYDVAFLFSGTYPTGTRRKKWLKARRRFRKKLKAKLWPPQDEAFKPEDWQKERDFNAEMTSGLLLKGFPMAHLLNPE